jgi:peptidase E
MIFLYSDFKPGISDVMDERLIASIDSSFSHVAYIPTEHEPKQRPFETICQRFAEIGVNNIEYIDLHVNWSSKSLNTVQNASIVYLAGGDPVPLLESLKIRGLKSELQKIAKFRILMGVSAGAMVLGKRLLNLDSNSYDRKREKSFLKGLSMFDFDFVPHLTDLGLTVNDIISLAGAQNQFIGCDDDSGVIVSDGVAELLGPNIIRFGA